MYGTCGRIDNKADFDFFFTFDFLSRCVRAGWTAVAMASSVERLDLYANWKASREGGRTNLMCCMTSRSKHFMRIGVSATGR